MKPNFKKIKIKLGILPYKSIRLSTGVIVEHYSNGSIKVIS